ncbi:Galactomannan galactosyltransferase [Dorcoceras hygrometricum]|uniref:Galactomannan galactosyltransferase n=1 Tax=Dorcoceras hygrometricum TaxID=472368 RepID=A0A2Z7D4V4_9LAMI|nr:Galactomannan galactosyltransferase [Dorcoceras hygrometricum]
MFVVSALLLVEGLIDIHEVPKDLIFDARTEYSFTGEQLTSSCKKWELKIEYRHLSDIVEKSITVKASSFDVVTHERFLLMTAIFGGVSVNWGRLLFKIFKDMVTPETRQARGYAVHISDEMEQWLNLSFEEFIASDANRRVDTASDTDGEPEIVVEKHLVQRSAEKEKDADFGASEDLVLGKKNEGFLSNNPSDEELMSLDDLLMQISDDMRLPSVTAAEVTKIKSGLPVEIHEVQDKDWYYASLPKISAHDKGKKPLEADDVVKGNPAREMVQETLTVHRTLSPLILGRRRRNFEQGFPGFSGGRGGESASDVPIDSHATVLVNYKFNYLQENVHSGIKEIDNTLLRWGKTLLVACCIL